MDKRWVDLCDSTNTNNFAKEKKMSQEHKPAAAEEDDDVFEPQVETKSSIFSIVMVNDVYELLPDYNGTNVS